MVLNNSSTWNTVPLYNIVSIATANNCLNQAYSSLFTYVEQGTALH